VTPNLRAPSKGAAIALMVAAPLMWSMAGVVTRQVQSAGPFELVFWRSLFAALATALLCYMTGRGTPWAATRALGRTGIFSAAMWTVMFTAFMVALTLTSTANVLIVMSIAPLVTALAARAFLDEPVPVRTWLAIAAASLGLAWMIGSGVEARAPREALGMLVALLVPIASAANVVALRRARAAADLVPAVMLAGVLSSLIVLPFASPFNASATDIAWLAFLGFFQLGLPCMLMVIASRSLLAPEIALLGLLEVVFGPLWAWLGAGEVPAATTLAGGALIVCALAINEIASLRVRSA
jgi:drug/metabolite transporter (DMT)-like permease